jgi:LysR family transcriptional activator of glutamate synthase operon
VKAMQDQGLTPHIRTEVDFGEFILGYVAAGEGITVMPQMIADQLPPGLRCARIDDFTSERVLHLMAHNRTIGDRLHRPWKEASPKR